MAGHTRELVDTLGKFEIFSKCSRREITDLVEAGSDFSLPAGWPLVQEGVPSDACYVITEGDVRVFSQREQVAEMGPGDVVGEMTLLGGGQRRATVTSSSRVAGLRIENDPLRAVLNQHDSLAQVFRDVYAAHSKD